MSGGPLSIGPQYAAWASIQGPGLDACRSDAERDVLRAVADRLRSNSRSDAAGIVNRRVHLDTAAATIRRFLADQGYRTDAAPEEDLVEVPAPDGTVVMLPRWVAEALAAAREVSTDSTDAATRRFLQSQGYSRSCDGPAFALESSSCRRCRSSSTRARRSGRCRARSKRHPTMTKTTCRVAARVDTTAPRSGTDAAAPVIENERPPSGHSPARAVGSRARRVAGERRDHDRDRDDHRDHDCRRDRHVVRAL